MGSYWALAPQMGAEIDLPLTQVTGLLRKLGLSGRHAVAEQLLRLVGSRVPLAQCAIFSYEGGGRPRIVAIGDRARTAALPAISQDYVTRFYPMDGSVQVMAAESLAARRAGAANPHILLHRQTLTATGPPSTADVPVWGQACRRALLHWASLTAGPGSARPTLRRHRNMHEPHAEPRRSIYYRYQVHAPWLASAHPPQDRKKVVIVGAGPIGLFAALELARLGVPCVLLESELQVSEGSRAIVFTRRSMEILQQVGVDAPITANGLPWRFGNSFYRGQRVYRMEAPHDPDDRFFPMINLQQQYGEACRPCGAPADRLRWGKGDR
jgi:hypothetical protein